ncbi:MAG TPA: DMT family transporter [Arenicellales bacterium]|nr:DMT family transporter [Arenicellales bacterium]
MWSSTYTRGVIMILASGLFLSTSGIGFRIIEQASGWQILFYRSFFMIGLLIGVLAVKSKGRLLTQFRGLRGEDFLLALFLGTGIVAYVFALLLTTVANALFILSSVPFITALLGWLILREAVPSHTWITIAMAMIGLAIMVGNGLASGRYLGNLIALWLPISYAASVILVRRSSQPNMLVALCLAGVVSLVCAAPFIGDLVISRHDLLVSAYLGIFQVGLGFTFMVLGARYVPAAQVGLLALVEPVLAPLWAWMVAAEIPAHTTLIGGAIIFLAISLDGAITMWRSRIESKSSGNNAP